MCNILGLAGFFFSFVCLFFYSGFLGFLFKLVSPSEHSETWDQVLFCFLSLAVKSQEWLIRAELEEDQREKQTHDEMTKRLAASSVYSCCGTELLQTLLIWASLHRCLGREAVLLLRLRLLSDLFLLRPLLFFIMSPHLTVLPPSSTQ